MVMMCGRGTTGAARRGEKKKEVGREGGGLSVHVARAERDTNKKQTTNRQDKHSELEGNKEEGERLVYLVEAKRAVKADRRTRLMVDRPPRDGVES